MRIVRPSKLRHLNVGDAERSPSDLSNGFSRSTHRVSDERDAPDSKHLATRRRRDIQGLRAVAVLLVALNHAGVGFLKGGYVGVDVFFVLSGYLITGLLVSAADKARPSRSEHSGRKHLFTYFSEFYARRARRILPAATLTLVVTDIAAWHLLNLYRAHQVLVDSISSTFFVANFHFASIGTNYFAMGQPPSPLQHFWSLSVEEQFYLVWPLLVAVALLGIAFLGRRDRHNDQPMSRVALRGLGIVAVIITVASLAYAVYDTHHSAVSAYFSSPARAWELGLGAILSLNVRRVARLPSVLLGVLGWFGIVAIIIASTMYSASTLFPGTPALLPTIGAAAVIAAGLHVDQASFAPSRILSLLPFRYIGDRSYSFYLWHWPVLILAMEHAGHSLSLTTNLLLLAGAFLLSIVTYSTFENPIRKTGMLPGSVALVLWPAAIATVLFVSSLNWSDYQNATNSAQSYALPASLVAPAQASLPQSTKTARSGWRPSSPTALVAAVAAVEHLSPIPSPLIPAALTLPSEHLYEPPQGCIARAGQTRSSICSIGDTSSTKTIVVFGDSHAQMWLPAILSFAGRKGYGVRLILHEGCNPWRWAGPERVGECSGWYEWAVPQVRALRPSLLIIATHYDVAPREDAEIKFSGPRSIENITAFGTAVRSAAHQIVVLGDPPGQEQEPVDCLVASHATMKTCSYSPTSGQTETSAGIESATSAFGVFLDTTPWLCYHGVCPMVVGHTGVYLNHDHITTTYAGELAPLFSAALTRVLASGKAARLHRASAGSHRTAAAAPSALGRPRAAA
ncbi:MAG: acyltransferase [Phenylobacterium sp.]|nr:MAG: acyltransferase [Phenylobacterium sp.]